MGGGNVHVEGPDEGTSDDEDREIKKHLETQEEMKRAKRRFATSGTRYFCDAASLVDSMVCICAARECQLIKRKCSAGAGNEPLGNSHVERARGEMHRRSRTG